jgi:CDP-glycerol glycerophosphotransferase (TagB/SpsB family)
MQMKRYLFYISQNYSFQILRPLQKAIRSRGDEVKWFCAGNMVNRDYLLPDEIQLTTVADARKYNPLAIFAPGNTIPDFFNGLKVAVFHGFNVGKLNRRGEEDHFRIRGCFDLYCTHGPNTTNRFRELADKFGYFSAIETGWPAIDPLFDSSVQSSNSDKPTILLCSTFSRNLTCAPHLYNEISRLSKKGNWRWLVQFHPKMASAIVEKYKGLQNENLSFIETDNVLPLLQQADLMVSDTSSILVMFLLQQKPVVTFRNISPKPYLLNITEADKLESAIIDTLKKPAELMNAIKELIAQTHPHNDGGSSERVLQAVDTFLRENKPQNNKPLNLIRNLKARRKLAYWKV